MSLYQSASCIYHNKIAQAVWLTQQQFALSQFWGQNSEVRVPAQLVSGKCSLPGFLMAVFLLFPHRVENEGSGVFSFSYKGTSPMGLQPYFYDTFNLITSSQALTAKIVTLRIRATMYDFGGGGGHKIQSITIINIIIKKIQWIYELTIYIYHKSTAKQVPILFLS